MNEKQLKSTPDVPLSAGINGSADDIRIVYRKVGELLPYVKNPRKHDAENIELLKAMLLEYGWTNPLLLDGANGILAGHGRVIAAKQIFEAGGSILRCPKNQIPTIDLHGFTAEQKRAYVIADNASRAVRMWDTAIQNSSWPGST